MSSKPPRRRNCVESSCGRGVESPGMQHMWLNTQFQFLITKGRDLQTHDNLALPFLCVFYVKILGTIWVVNFFVWGTICVLLGYCSIDLLRSCCCRRIHHCASELWVQKSQMLSRKDHRCKSCRCVCLGEVTNKAGTHIQLGSLQVLSFFGASRSSVIGCVCVKRSLCKIDCWRHSVLRVLSYITVEIYSLGLFHRWKYLNRMVRYRD